MKKKMNMNRLLKMNQAMNQLNISEGAGDESQFTTPAGEEADDIPVPFDPRSPTHDFDRTPLGLGKKESVMRGKPLKLDVNKHF